MTTLDYEGQVLCEVYEKLSSLSRSYHYRLDFSGRPGAALGQHGHQSGKGAGHEIERSKKKQEPISAFVHPDIQLKQPLKDNSYPLSTSQANISYWPTVTQNHKRREFEELYILALPN